MIKFPFLLILLLANSLFAKYYWHQFLFPKAPSYLQVKMAIGVTTQKDSGELTARAWTVDGRLYKMKFSGPLGISVGELNISYPGQSEDNITAFGPTSNELPKWTLILTQDNQVIQGVGDFNIPTMPNVKINFSELISPLWGQVLPYSDSSTISQIRPSTHIEFNIEDHTSEKLWIQSTGGRPSKYMRSEKELINPIDSNLKPIFNLINTEKKFSQWTISKGFAYPAKIKIKKPSQQMIIKVLDYSTDDFDLEDLD
jgi:hypothetical protein